MDLKNNDWLLDVLFDLETFCEENGLEVTKTALAEAREVAEHESCAARSKEIQLPAGYGRPSSNEH